MYQYIYIKRFNKVPLRLTGIALSLLLALASVTGVALASVGDIGGVIDTIEFDSTKGKTPDIIHVSGNVYAIAYEGDSYDGTLATIEIAANGQITNSVIDTLVFDASKGKVPVITSISGDIYAIAYQGDGDDGMLITVEIDSNGAITNTVIDTLEFDTVMGKVPVITNISGDIYAIAYQGNSSLGYIVTVDVATNGQITNTVLDSMLYDTNKGLAPDMIYISNDVYAITYEGVAYEGMVTTIGIESQAILAPTVTTDNATTVEETIATLHGTITNDGGEACQYRFEYGTASGGPYTGNTGWTGSKTTGQSFSANVTGLSKGTKYYFRAQAKNSAGTSSASEISLLTKPDAPVDSSFSATTISSTVIDLSWTKGEGANRTMVRRKIGGFPINMGDGDQVYFDTGTSVSDIGLIPSTTYHYRAWSEVTGSQQWSDGFGDVTATTSAGPSPPAEPTAVGGMVYPINRAHVILPWLSLILIPLSAGAFRLVMRKVRN